MPCDTLITISADLGAIKRSVLEAAIKALPGLQGVDVDGVGRLQFLHGGIWYTVDQGELKVALYSETQALSGVSGLVRDIKRGAAVVSIKQAAIKAGYQVRQSPTNKSQLLVQARRLANVR